MQQWIMSERYDDDVMTLSIVHCAGGSNNVMLGSFWGEFLDPTYWVIGYQQF